MRFARAYGVVKDDAKHADSLLEQAVTSARYLLMSSIHACRHASISRTEGERN